MKKQSAGSQTYVPRPYQERGIRYMIKNAVGAFLLDPGLGKTSISLAALQILRSKGFVKAALVVAPLKPMYSTWPGEVEKWRQFAPLTWATLHGPGKLKALEGPAVDFYLINPEGLPWLYDQLAGLRRADWPFDMLIVDESTKFKNSQSGRFKLMRKMVGFFKRRYILTGTPTANQLQNIFAQMYLVDEGASLGRFITHFRKEYFDDVGYKYPDWRARPDTESRIAEAIAPLCIRMSAADYLTLPPLVNDYTWLELPGPVRAQYEDMQKEFITDVGGEIVIAPGAATAGGKCRQMLSGAMYIGEGKTRRVKQLHTVKLEALQDLVEELQGQPVLVFYEFKHELERIMDWVPDVAVLGESPSGDAKLIKQFNAGTLPVLVAHPITASHGLNLQGACAHVCWFGLTWDFEMYDQAIKRVWRQGNTATRVVVHHLCMRDSLDERVVQVLESKDVSQTRFVGLINHLQEK